MKYVLTGGAGNITRPLAAALLQNGHAVTLIGRNAANLQPLTEMGAQAAIGSVEDVAFLTNTFAGAHAVYTMVPPKWDAANWKGFIGAIGTNYATAIEQAGVKKVVNLSSIGAHLPDGCGPVSGLYRVEAALNALADTDVLHLRPAYFYYNLLAQTGMIKQLGIMGGNFGGADRKLPIVDTAEIAAVAAEALQNLAFEGKQVRYIASDEVTTDEIAATLGAAINRPGLPWVVFSDEQAYGGMLQNGLSEEVARNYTEMGNAIQTGRMMDDYHRHQVALGTTKLQDFAKVFASVFAAG